MVDGCESLARLSAVVWRLDDISDAKSGSRSSNSDSGGLESSKALDSGGSEWAASRNGGRTSNRSRSDSGRSGCDDAAVTFDWARSPALGNLVADVGFVSHGVAVAIACWRRRCFASLNRCSASCCQAS